MATNLKHVGRMKRNKAKVLIAFRTLPGDPTSCLVVGTAELNDQYHNAIINLVESAQGQDTSEFGDILSIRHFPDGRLMLPALHQDGRLIKVPTKDVEVTPNTTDIISLDDLNQLIAEQRGVTIDQLAVAEPGQENKPREAATINEVVEKPATPPATKNSNDPLSDTDLARSYRSQADAMYKEAARLRKQADELDPPAKKSAKAKEEASA
jgi:hypothetical protein